MLVELGDPTRPRLRGAIHRWAVPVAIGLTVVLAVRAPTGGGRAATIIYGVCVTAMLAVSAVYHSPVLAGSPRRVLRRLDHATILVAIAGTYTAVNVLALEGTARVVLLIVAWGLAVVGVTIRMLWLDAPAGLVAAVYVVAGWMALLDLPTYADRLTAIEMMLVVGGGVAYTLGAVVYATKRPDPWPAVFGFHELFHVCVVIGALAHWAAIFSLAGR